MFDFIKNLFSSPTPEQAQTSKDVQQSRIKSMSISNNYIKKVIGADGLSTVFNNVKYELYALYPDIRIDESLLKELVRSVAFAEPRSVSTTEALQEVLPNLPKKMLGEFARNIHSLSASNRDIVQSQKTGFEWYAWQSFCKVHQHMNNVFIRFDSPPSAELLKDNSPVAHHAGSQDGCNCWTRTIIGKSDLIGYKAPYKVCLNGKIIVTMKKKEFLEIFVEPRIKIP